MRINRFILIALCLMLGQFMGAQQLSQTIRGVVVDKDSRIPVPGANVILQYSEPLLGTSTDLDGKFRLDNVPLGRHNLQVSYLGYEDIIIPNIHIGSGKEAVINIEITEKVIQMNEVVINGNGKKGERQHA